jgi:DNA-binding response OmpR family regulator
LKFKIPSSSTWSKTRLPRTPVLACFAADSGGTPDLILDSESLQRPIRLGEVLDRITYLLSGRGRHAESRDTNLAFGCFLLRGDDGALVDRRQNAEIPLTDKESLLLRTLAGAENQSIRREDLLRDVWGYAKDTETHTLETHLYRLRQKLESANIPIRIEVQDGAVRMDAGDRF